MQSKSQKKKKKGTLLIICQPCSNWGLLSSLIPHSIAGDVHKPGSYMLKMISFMDLISFGGLLQQF